MRILLTNDDGIFAPGIRALLVALQGAGEIFVAAPSLEQSATSQAITVHQPIRVDAYPLDGQAAAGWSIGGTPADCVKLALEALMEVKPDAVVSGMNAGMNLGNDVLYSGTVGAAIEGALHGIPSIAVSYEAGRAADFSAAAKIAGNLVLSCMQNKMQPATLLNINIPKRIDFTKKAIAYTKLGRRTYANTFDKRTDPRGRSYYWMGGEVVASDHSPDTDIYATEHGMISVTPIHFDLTNDAFLDTLKDWELTF